MINSTFNSMIHITILLVRDIKKINEKFSDSRKIKSRNNNSNKNKLTENIIFIINNCKKYSTKLLYKKKNKKNKIKNIIKDSEKFL